MTHTDINTKGWISRLSPEIRPYVLLMRLDRPIGVWLLLLPGWWAILLARGGVMGLQARDLWLLLLFGFGAIVMRGAGCVINDLWDRRLDGKVERTKGRPLASGAINVWKAFGFLFSLLLVGLLVLLQMNMLTVILGCVSMLFVIAYPAMKRITWWPQAFLGLTFNFGALMGWAAVTGEVGLAAVFLYAAGFFWTLGYDTIYAHQDIEDDMRIGVKSSAIRLRDQSKPWIAKFYMAACGLLFLALLAGRAGPFSYLVLAFAGGHLWWQLRQWHPIHPLSSLRIFKSNRIFGWIVLAALALSGIYI